MLYLGIDPGASGGLAVIDGGKHVETTSMPATEKDIWLWVCMEQREQRAVIEYNTGFVGGEGNPGSAMFKFGTNHGLLEMALIAAAIPYEKVSPAKWQKALGITPRKKGVGAESRTQFKNRLKSRAQSLFPSAKVTLSTCDALLIAHYCRLKEEGKL